MKRSHLSRPFPAAVVFSLAASTLTLQADHHKAVPLFDGKSLEGWTVKSGFATYKVVDGTIVGTTAAGSGNTFLCTNKEYGDFELEFEVKCHNSLNSGVQIRSQLKNPDGKYGGRVNGPQVEIEASGKNGAEAGYIYGEATKFGWLTPDGDRKPHKHFKDGEWNHYKVIAQGPKIQTWINGQPITTLVHDEIYKTHPKGLIGLQVHGVGNKGPFDVAWRNITIKELGGGNESAAAAVGAGAGTTVALFDGTSLDHWMNNKGNAPKWEIEDGALAGKKGSGYIWTKEPFGNFVLELEFKMSKKCNSGVFFRTDPKNPVQGGFEIQVMDSHGRKAGKHDCGALYDARAPSVNAVKPAGEWNTMRVEAAGPKLLVDLNGERVQDLNLDDWTEGNKNPDGSKNKFKTALKDLPRSGHIGFQDHGHPVWYRNVVLVRK